jgi:hypothetical protein
MIWVEVLSRHREVVARHRCSDAEIRVGRGYDNDVIVDDPYVAAHHVRILRDTNGDLVAEDLGSANGLFADRSRERVARITIHGDRPIRIGHSYLRIRDAEHMVAPERTAALPPSGWQALLALGAATIGVVLLALWLDDFEEFKLSNYVFPLAAMALIVLAWAALWAVLSRLFAGQLYFERNLKIAVFGILAGLVGNELSEIGAFALSWRGLAAYKFVGLWCLVALVCFFHVRMINPSRLELKGGILAGFAGLVVALQLLVQSEFHLGSGQQDYIHRLMPPVVRLSPRHDEAKFFADLEQLKTKLDQARTEGLGASSGQEAAGSDDQSNR